MPLKGSLPQRRLKRLTFLATSKLLAAGSFPAVVANISITERADSIAPGPSVGNG